MSLLTDTTKYRFCHRHSMYCYWDR